MNTYSAQIPESQYFLRISLKYFVFVRFSRQPESRSFLKHDRDPISPGSGKLGMSEKVESS
ncbi:hypothetical protein HID58_022365 [Brassica napus]|uniref:Uncharacterized protein n=2 Tax=Brassica TaxID=3705 RepID=A0ABQ8CZ26_BRANA|nr:hypothetical protein HID58_091806 [Brassica napus]KAH0852502.1 hypothetical protein HID58_093957 [Brassica napus]KAH0852570.1 hypothetical protein HID58_093953 [Brassica napus]KAH0922347.1 hypothetical protein HID58_022365 [Brassica napus]